MSATQLLAKPRADRITGRTAVALGVLVSFWALILIDEMVVNISLAGIGEALSMSQTELSWVVNAYLLPFGGLLLLGGRAGDILGKRRVFIAGVALYTAGCLIRVVAPDAWLLIVARTMQGTGAALATPCVVGLIVSLFAEGPLRRKAIGIYTVVGGAGTAIGLLIIGVLGTVGSWRLVLLLSGVIGLVLLVFAPVVIPEAPRRPGRFDLGGALVATLGLVAIVYALANSQSDGWRNGRVIVFFMAGLLLFGLFVLITKRSRQPLLDLGLFADRSRVGAYLVLALMPGTEIGLFFFLSQYFQLVLGYTPLIVALAFLSVSVGMFGTAGLAVRLHPRIGGRYVAAIGALVLLVANLWLLRMTVGDGYWLAVLPSLLLVGMGIAFTTIPATIHATSGIESDSSGSASSVMSAVQNVGSSLSLAIIVAVAATASANATRNPPAGMPPEAVNGYAFGEAMWATFVTGAVFSVITALAATLIRRRAGASRQQALSDMR
jgi:MFS family permease